MTDKKVVHIDCTAPATKGDIKRSIMYYMKQDPDVFVFHRPNMEGIWLDQIRLAYESGHDVKLSQAMAPQLHLKELSHVSKDSTGIAA